MHVENDMTSMMMTQSTSRARLRIAAAPPFEPDGKLGLREVAHWNAACRGDLHRSVAPEAVRPSCPDCLAGRKVPRQDGFAGRIPSSSGCKLRDSARPWFTWL